MGKWQVPISAAGVVIALGILIINLNSGQADLLNAKFDALNAKFEAVDARFDGLDDKFSARVDGLDAKFDAQVVGINARLDDTIGRLDSLGANLSSMDARITTRIDALQPGDQEGMIWPEQLDGPAVTSNPNTGMEIPAGISQEDVNQ